MLTRTPLLLALLVPATAAVCAAEPLPEAIAAAAREHWAFQPLRRPAIPPVTAQHWLQSPIDAFVLARLEQHHIEPSPPADKRTLLRRVTYDLTGLPPTYAQLSAFQNDESPDAFARRVDRLLASPAYGERWGRHWLDVARYADTKGYLAGNRETRYAYAYTYRDYVVDSFNGDLPYDQFVIEQMAADLLPDLRDRRALAALGWLTLGRRFNNSLPDIIDDRIDVVTRGFMGLTVSCARCHDHKYDPIPTADYYSLYGVFASCEEPSEPPLLVDPAQHPGHDKFLAELKRREEAARDYRDEQQRNLQQHARRHIADYLMKAQQDNYRPADERVKLKPQIIDRWKTLLHRATETHDPVFAFWHAYAAVAEPSDGKLPAAAQDIAGQLDQAARTDASKPLNGLLLAAFLDNPPVSMAGVAETYGEVFRRVDPPAETAGTTGDAAVVQTPSPATDQLRQLLQGNDSPLVIRAGEVERLLEVRMLERLRSLRRRIERWKAESPLAPPRGMVLVDKATPAEPQIFIRGNPRRPGAAVPRQFLALLAGDQRQPFAQGSGRLELARQIASHDNPLTARVMVNRVWMHHFGSGLVQSPSNFGARSDPPTHPGLLDFLASRLIADGWSLKRLHRTIVLSSTYQQQSALRSGPQQRDPENKLLWRTARRRLEFEAIRDSWLVAAGTLDGAMGGQPVDFSGGSTSTRRTLYGLVDRQRLWSAFRTFDFASPEASTAKRPHTIVPLQALVMMNSPFVAAQARQAVAQPEVAGETDSEQRIRSLYRRILTRDPTAEEIEIAHRFLDSPSGSPDTVPADDSTKLLSPWALLAQALMMSNEAIYVD